MAWSALTNTPNRVRRWERSSLTWSTFLGICGTVALVGRLVLDAVDGEAHAALALLGAFVPLAIVAPFLFWLGRNEPGPMWAKGHAFVMGAGVAFAVATTINTLTNRFLAKFIIAPLALALTIALIAPLVEEAAKYFGVRRSARQGVIGTPIDGVIYAGFVALGFTVVEDIMYLSRGLVAGKFAATFLLRCVISPFAHATFTALVGISVGLKEERRGRVWVGFFAAALLHVAWNTTALWSDTQKSLKPIIFGYSLCTLTALTCAFVLLKRRNRDMRLVVSGLSLLVTITPVTAAELVGVSSGRGWRSCLAQSREGREVAENRLLALRHAARLCAGEQNSDAIVAIVRQLPRPLMPSAQSPNTHSASVKTKHWRSDKSRKQLRQRTLGTR